MNYHVFFIIIFIICSVGCFVCDENGGLRRCNKEQSCFGLTPDPTYNVTVSEVIVQNLNTLS